MKTLWAIDILMLAVLALGSTPRARILWRNFLDK